MTSHSRQSTDVAMTITCPMCRQVNQIPSNQKRVVGIDTRCSVCWDKMSEIFMPVCGHICLCHECAQSLHEIGGSAPNAPIGGNFPLRERADADADVDASASALAERLMGHHNGPIYIIVPAGMGCMWYMRRRGVGQPIGRFLMHSDNWGQYGPDTDHRHILQEFTNGFQLLP